MPRRLAIATLAVLSAIGAELLAAYDDSTGRPGELAVAVVFFACLYGCPALLIRDVARRRGLGWGGIALLAAAAGLVQAGLLDQSLFAREYGGVRGWDEMVEPTWVDALGLSPYAVQAFVAGHVVFSFCAPIAVAEGLAAGRAHEPWLRRGGAVAAVGLWSLVAVMIVLDDPPDTDGATAVQLIATAVVAGVLLAVAVRRRGVAPARPPATLAAAAALGFVAATLHALLPATWAGTAAALLLLAAVVALVRRRVWDLRAAAALATGALLSRGVLAFTYVPLVGEVAAGPKYVHNAGMLLLVVGVGALAQRRAARTAAHQGHARRGVASA